MANEPRNTKSLRRPHKPGPLVLLAAKSTVGAGNTYDLGGAFLNFGLVLFRATTGAAGASTKASVKIEGSLNPQSTSAKWFTIGAATRNVTTAAGTLAAMASTGGAVTAVRASINSFTTSASTTNPDGVAVTAIVAPYGV